MTDLEDLKLALLGGRRAREGDALPAAAISLLSYARLSDMERFLRDIADRDIEGEVIEAGVWKGGASIFMRAVLNSLGLDKMLYVADSFDGVPAPDPDKYPVDAGDYHYTLDYLKVPQEEVEANFRRFSLLENVAFVKGLFKDTLHEIDASFSLIRLDGDLYESTIDSMKALYPKLSIGGYCIIDDWSGTQTAGPAVRDYMKSIGARFNKDEWVHKDGTKEGIEFNGPAANWKKLA